MSWLSVCVFVYVCVCSGKAWERQPLTPTGHKHKPRTGRTGSGLLRRGWLRVNSPSEIDLSAGWAALISLP